MQWYCVFSHLNFGLNCLLVVSLIAYQIERENEQAI